MSWLERLKAYVADAGGLAGHCQNRQNPGSVSFDGASVASIHSNQDATADPWAEFAVAIEHGALQQCQACRHFTDLIPADGDNLGVKRAGWCRRYNVATDPLLPFWCDGYSPTRGNV
jgi:hypothetical protein